MIPLPNVVVKFPQTLREDQIKEEKPQVVSQLRTLPRIAKTIEKACGGNAARDTLGGF